MTYSIEIFKAFPKERKKPVMLFLSIGYALALTLYYIDEGNYHFNNLFEQPLEWIFVTMYALLIAGSCGLVYTLLSKITLSHGARLFSSILGGILLIPVLILIVALLVPLLSF